ncbi:MAG: peroxiredoxin family protein [Firmicutes bacterium]|nr:peroxiredoxin family protein [Bacillota bacterium]
MVQLKEKIRIDAIIPFFDLPSNKGKNIRPWDYKQRKHLVVYFFGGADCVECRNTLRQFAEHYTNYRQLNAEVLAIGRDNLDNLSRLADSLSLPFPVLSDKNGEVTNAYTYINPKTSMPYPSIFVADKFGSLEEEWIVESEYELPTQDEILSVLQLFELRCPE